jgi:2-polyprenyl-6-methoxyphenol hydroxylase-like FAD-dependent oxidoreductase
VLVVGAGPTGLLLAAELQRRGVPCHLIDARPAPLHWDRATVIHPRSLEVFESLGLVDKFLAAGTKQRAVRIHSQGQLLGTLELATCGSIYGYNLGLAEDVTESILTDYLHEQGGEVNRGARLVGLNPQAEKVLAEVEKDGFHYQIEARFGVGCDGIHSAMRELSGIDFEGHDITRPWAVFDATVENWAERYDASFVYLETVPVIQIGLPSRRWRIYMRPSSDEADLIAEATATLRRYVPNARYVEIENPTRFQCHTKIAARFRSGAILLAGDAAHLCSPTEGHGMNSGLQDAVNLAWKLALVYRGADPSLLDSYEAERRPVAEMITKSGDAAEASQTLIDPDERELRDDNIRSVLAESTTRHHEVVAEAELNISYAGSPIVIGDAVSRLTAGQRLPATVFVEPPRAARRRVHELAHQAGHTLLLFGGRTARPAALANLFDALRESITESPVFSAAFAFSTERDQAEYIGRIEARNADALDVRDMTLIVVRPDGYIGMRSDADHLEALASYRARLLGLAGR